VPAGQSTHAVAALASEYVPAPHATHLARKLPEMAWYRPAPHATHVPLAPLYPESHTTGHPVAPTSVAVGHAVHAWSPMLLLYVLAGHGQHCLLAVTVHLFEHSQHLEHIGSEVEQR